MLSTPTDIANALSEVLRDPCARSPADLALPETQPEGAYPAQSSGDELEDPVGSFLLNQLRPNEQALARAHVADLAKALTSGTREEARLWAARRAGAEDALAELFQARVQALLRTHTTVNGPLLKALRTLDMLSSAAHRRGLDWLEVVERLGRPRTPAVRIGSAAQVAVLVADGEEQ